MATKSQVFLGIDLGTTALKAVLADGRSRVVAHATIKVPVQRPRPGWAEQNPEDWWKALVKALKLLGPRRQEVAAISFSGQMHGAVLLDRHTRLVRPAILWSDSRASEEASNLNSLHPQFASVAGVRAMASFVAPKLLWLQKNEKNQWSKVAHVLAPKDWLRFRLTGTLNSDPVDASGMWLCDAAARNWSQPILAAAGTSPGIMPQIIESKKQSGTLQAEAARALGMTAGIPIMAGTGDVAASAIGLGLINEGDGVISMGTAAQIIVTKEKHVPAPARNVHAFCHGLPDRWFHMAALLNGAAPLAWVASCLGQKDIGKLLQSVGRKMNSPSPLLFLPYLSGDRTPNDDPAMRAAFMGLEPTTDAADLTRAVMEGVALSLADCYDCLVSAGSKPRSLLIVGGGTKSALWTQMIAAALNRELTLAEVGEYGAALGAARLARLGLTGEAVETVCTPPTKTRRMKPDPALADYYREKLVPFRSLYQALKDIR